MVSRRAGLGGEFYGMPEVVSLARLSRGSLASEAMRSRACTTRFPDFGWL